MKAFGEGGAGIFPTATASLPDVLAHYRVEQIGVVEDIRERYFLISPERRLTHPAAAIVSLHARSGLFAASSIAPGSGGQLRQSSIQRDTDTRLSISASAAPLRFNEIGRVPE